MPRRLQIDEVAFRRDWRAGIPTRELDALYGIGSSSALAKRLGLPQRRQGRPPAEASPARVDGGASALTGGEWVLGPDKVQRWRASA